MGLDGIAELKVCPHMSLSLQQLGILGHAVDFPFLHSDSGTHLHRMMQSDLFGALGQLLRIDFL